MEAGLEHSGSYDCLDRKQAERKKAGGAAAKQARAIAATGPAIQNGIRGRETYQVKEETPSFYPRS